MPHLIWGRRAVPMACLWWLLSFCYSPLPKAYFFNMLGEHAAEIGSRKGEPFGSLAGVTAVLAEHPKLKAVVETFRSSPGMVLLQPLLFCSKATPFLTAC